MARTLIIAFVVSLIGANRGYATQVFRSSELVLPMYQSSQLAKDRPFSDGLFESNKVLWAMGRTSVWRWDLLTNRLTRIPVAGEGAGALRQILAAKDLFVATDSHLYRVQFDPLKILEIDISSDRPLHGRSLALVKEGERIWWAHSEGIYQLEKNGLMEQFKTPLLGKARKVFFSPTHRTLWALHSRRLIRFDLQKTPYEPESIHETKFPFIGAHASNAAIQASTNHTVLRFGQDGELTQIIPVEGEHKLIASTHTPRYHAYLFSDRLYELYDMNSKKLVQSSLALRPKRRIDGIRVSADYVAVFNQGDFNVYHLNRLTDLAQFSESSGISTKVDGPGIR